MRSFSFLCKLEVKIPPVKEDFDLEGCEVLAWFSIRLSNAAICLERVKSQYCQEDLCQAYLLIIFSLTLEAEPEGKLLLNNCLRPSPISLPCLFLSTGHLSSILTKLL